MKDKMKLGVLPTTKVVKLLVLISGELKATLDHCSELHAEATGEKNDVVRLIPFMLEAFMASDRTFRKARR